MTRLVLVRHGETVWHAENRYAGTSDVPLTPHGQEQAHRLAEWAAGAGLHAMWSSTLGRARATAAACASATGLDRREDERLGELAFGQCEGLTQDEMADRFPEALAAFRFDPVHHHLPGGEDPRDAVRRGEEALRAICREHPGGRVLVVAHGTLIRLLLCSLVGLPLSSYRRLFPFIRNCGITEIRRDDDGVALLEFNTPIDPGPEDRSV